MTKQELKAERDYLDERLAKFEQEKDAGWKKWLENQQWIPVSERLPEAHGWCVCYTPEIDANRKINVEYFRGFSRTWSGGFEITHWMPLPQPPETDG